MSRPRVLLALLLSIIWCLAAWHVDLEAVGMMFEHEHHAEHEGDSHHHAPAGGLHDDHDGFLARDVAKDQLRIGAGAALVVLLLGLMGALTAALRPGRLAPREPRRRRETDPPFLQVWQFVRRCAPLSAAPPAWR